MICQYSWHRKAGVSPFGNNSDQKRTSVPGEASKKNIFRQQKKKIAHIKKKH
jgi:hypothetical protein